MAGMLAAIGAPYALASGSYVVSACSPTMSAGAWQPLNTSVQALAQGNLCGGPPVGPLDQATEQGALFGEDVVGSATQMPAGAVAGWLFTAPLGTTITAVSAYRSLQTDQADLQFEVGLFNVDGAPLDACRTPPGSPTGCSLLNHQAPVTETGLSDGVLFFGIRCSPVPSGSCTAGGSRHLAQADLYSVEVTLAEPGLPAVSALGGSTSGAVSGMLPVTFTASDVSGIAQVAVDGAGAQLALQSQSCDYSQTQPCPQLPAGRIDINTLALPDGPQTLMLRATNAAGNITTTQTSPVVVDNHGPPAPTSLSAAPVGAGSSSIILTWANPVSPPQPIVGAQGQLCQATCAPPVAVTPSGPAQLTAAGPGAYTVRLSLTDSYGKTGAAATVPVTIPPANTSGPIRPPPPAPSGHTKLTARISGRHLYVSGVFATIENANATVSWRARRHGRTLGHGSRNVRIRAHRLAVTFTLNHLARTGTLDLAVRLGHQLLATAQARR
ncbi:MAG: hypothetical protein QOF77_1371 [Solirubrobacteraceae bacterium]|nr:hypothetical protein [Solirubrobacteraceae bacterium]